MCIYMVPLEEGHHLVLVWNKFTILSVSSGTFSLCDIGSCSDSGIIKLHNIPLRVWLVPMDTPLCFSAFDSVPFPMD